MQERYSEKEKSLKKTGRKRRWAEKEYSKELLEKINSSLRDGEKQSYEYLRSTLAEEYDLINPRDLLLLDIVVKDFLRVQRIQRVLSKEGDFNEVEFKSGTISKSHEGGYLLNAVETQLRNNLKELGLTRKEHDKKKINDLGKGVGDFTDFLTINTDENKKSEQNKKKTSDK